MCALHSQLEAAGQENQRIREEAARYAAIAENQAVQLKHVHSLARLCIYMERTSFGLARRLLHIEQCANGARNSPGGP